MVAILNLRITHAVHELAQAAAFFVRFRYHVFLRALNAKLPLLDIIYIDRVFAALHSSLPLCISMLSSN